MRLGERRDFCLSRGRQSRPCLHGEQLPEGWAVSDGRDVLGQDRGDETGDDRTTWLGQARYGSYRRKQRNPIEIRDRQIHRRIFSLHRRLVPHPYRRTPHKAHLQAVLRVDAVQTSSGVSSRAVESELENAGKDVVMDIVGRYSSLSTKAGFCGGADPARHEGLALPARETAWSQAHGRAEAM
jgi:hypothetical protein